MQFPVADQTKVNDPLFESPADWISPGYDDEIFATGGHPMAPGSPPSRWFDNPPATDGRKVVITRHGPLRARQGRRAVGVEVVPARPPPDPDGLRDHRRGESARPSARRCAAVRVRSSRRATRWATRCATRSGWRCSTWSRAATSARPGMRWPRGSEYLILQPEETSDPFTVTLEAGAYTVEWYSVTTARRGRRHDFRSNGAGPAGFAAPFAVAGAAVLYLKKDD